jgi:microcystin-dependent protein
MPRHNHTVQTIPNYNGTDGYWHLDWMADPETVQTSYAGNDQPHNNMQPYAAVHFIIKY